MSRLLLTPPLPGALNMALDEVLLRAIGETGPVVRVYQWSPPTLTLGYGQSAGDVDFAGCAARGVDVTRRLTGGRAVLHADELTYSVLVPADLLGVGRNVTQAYEMLSGGLARALGELGLDLGFSQRHRPDSGRDPACFASALGGDLTADGRKLVGSAQCHKFGGILQHGSLPLSVDLGLLAACLHRPPRARGDWTCLRELGRDLTPTAFAQALGRGFAGLCGPLGEPATPTPAETAAAEELARARYATDEWVRRL
jgi:lipoate-protein ligase A